MSRRAANRAIATYLLQAAGLDEPTAQTMIGVMKIDTPGRILAVTSEQLLRGDKIGAGDAVDVLNLQKFIKSIIKREGNSPSSLEEWREKINPTAFEEFFSTGDARDPSTPALMPTGHISENIKKFPTINIKVGDYPSFTGRHDDWYSFKAKFSALTRLHGNSDVIDFFDTDDGPSTAVMHGEKRKSDTEYDTKVRTVYSILEVRTSDGTAASLITKHAASQDGALAWRSLRDYYDQDGNRDVFEIRSRLELSQLRLDYNSPGGFNRYHDHFFRLIKQIEDCGTVLSDREKRAYFVGGIKDRDYASLKDSCEKDNFNETIVRFSRKATELGKMSGPTRRQANKVTQNIKPTHAPRGPSTPSADRSAENISSRLPAAVWQQMSPEARPGFVEATRKANRGLIKPPEGQYTKESSTQRTAARMARTKFPGKSIAKTADSYNKSASSKTDGTLETTIQKVWGPLRHAKITKTIKIRYTKVPIVPKKEKSCDTHLNLNEAAVDTLVDLSTPEAEPIVPDVVHVAEPMSIMPTEQEIADQEPPSDPENNYQVAIPKVGEVSDDDGSEVSTETLVAGQNVKNREIKSYSPLNRRGRGIVIVSRQRGDKLVEIIGHYIGPDNIPYLDIRTDGVVESKPLQEYAKKFAMFVIEYAYRNQLNSLARHLYQRRFGTVTNILRDFSLTSNDFFIHRPIFSSRTLSTAAATAPERSQCFGVPDCRPRTCPTFRNPVQGHLAQKLTDLYFPPQKKLVHLFMMTRRWSNDFKGHPGYPHDMPDNPDVLHPRIITPKHEPTYIPCNPKITEVAKIHVVKIVFERDLGRGIFIREAQILPYGEVRTRWRHLLMKYILEGRPRSPRDELHEWAYFEYELAHNLPRGSIMEWFPEVLPVPLDQPILVRHYNEDRDHPDLDPATRAFRNLTNMSQRAEQSSEESIQSDFSSDPQAHILMATQLPTRTLVSKGDLAGHSHACVDTAADMCSIGRMT